VKKNYTAADYIAFSLVGAVGLISVLYALFGWDTLSKFLVHQATAAWVQAVGSIVAIWAAGQAVVRAHELEKLRAREADRELRGRRLAVVVELARATSKSVQFVANEYSSREKFHGIADGSAYHDPEVISSIGFPINAIALHELDDAQISHELLVMGAHCRQMRNTVGDVIARPGHLNGSDFQKIFGFLAWTAAECAKCYDTIRCRAEAINSHL
jgi:hypothetical protein